MSAFNVDHFIARNIQDAMAQATAQHWLRRAEEFEQAKPRPSDFRGRASDAQIAARAEGLAAKADACRSRAAVCSLSEDEQAMILDFVRLAMTAAASVPETGVAA